MLYSVERFVLLLLIGITYGGYTKAWRSFAAKPPRMLTPGSQDSRFVQPVDTLSAKQSAQVMYPGQRLGF